MENQRLGPTIETKRRYVCWGCKFYEEEHGNNGLCTHPLTKTAGAELIRFDGKAVLGLTGTTPGWCPFYPEFELL